MPPRIALQGELTASELKTVLSIVLVIAVLAAAGALSYVIMRPKTEALTEFYLLGINGRAEGYPTYFTVAATTPPTATGPVRVLSVQYGANSPSTTDPWGKVILGIVNHEGRDASYVVRMVIAGQQVEIPFADSRTSEIGPVVLADEHHWEQEVGILPQHIGKNQEVEVLLFKNGGNQPYLKLHLWIDVEEGGQSP